MKPQRFRIEHPWDGMGWAFYPLPSFYVFHTPSFEDIKGSWGFGVWFLFWSVEAWFPKLYSVSERK